MGTEFSNIPQSVPLVTVIDVPDPKNGVGLANKCCLGNIWMKDDVPARTMIVYANINIYIIPLGITLKGVVP